MGITSLQVCMDSSNWIQDTIQEETELDSSSSPSEDIFTCSRPLMERKLRPQHDQPLNCPRCDSTHTKFCYYNNYSLSQPRYFCKSCRRYWTKGGNLRNIPVGGGCRKNKKVSSKKSNDTPIHHIQTPNINQIHGSSIPNFPEMAFSHFMGGFGNPSNFMLENPTPVDFLGNVDINNGYGEINSAQNYLPAGFCSTFGMPNFGTINYEGQNTVDVKPNPKLLSLEWHHDQGCSINNAVGNISTGGLGSWTGFMNGYGTSTTNSLL